MNIKELEEKLKRAEELYGQFLVERDRLDKKEYWCGTNLMTFGHALFEIVKELPPQYAKHYCPSEARMAGSGMGDPFKEYRNGKQN